MRNASRQRCAWGCAGLRGSGVFRPPPTLPYFVPPMSASLVSHISVLKRPTTPKTCIAHDWNANHNRVYLTWDFSMILPLVSRFGRASAGTTPQRCSFSLRPYIRYRGHHAFAPGRLKYHHQHITKIDLTRAIDSVLSGHPRRSPPHKLDSKMPPVFEGFVGDDKLMK